LRRAPPAAAPPPGLDICRSLLVYDPVAAPLLTKLKYRNERAALGWLADGMARLFAPPEQVVVTWVPTTRARRRRRGFDQAELLARAIARRWQAPCAPLLARAAGPPQTGRSRGARLAGVDLRPCRPLDAVVPVVVVDDVLTTGTTLRCAAAALRAAGHRWLGALTAARKP
jgi:predicted amidophosphoribosyltransferase